MLRKSPSLRRRRGMILIVVLSLLTLFAIVGISFVLVSDSYALSAKIAKESENTFRPDGEPESAFSLFLSQMVYDVEDDETGIYSALRGHSLARTMYGYDSTPGVVNDKAYSGIGRPRIPSPYIGNNSAGAAQWLGYMVNPTYFSGDNFLIDPERVAWRANPAAARGQYVSAAAPYTFPDHNSFFLGSADPTTGRVVLQSFHRPWLFGTLDQSNPNWSTPWGKYLTPRPRPAEHPAFPLPEDATGDVKNRVGYPGGNDSIWIDIGAPVMTSADGRKYKMLFAPLILELDGRLNVNVHGNQRGPGNAHRSNQGWGPWEINPERVLAAGELRNLLIGNPSTGTPRTSGRYGTNVNPGVTGSQSTGGTIPRPWGPIDFDGDGAARYTLAYEGTPFFTQPNFPANFANADAGERTNHPLLYNPFRSINDDRLLPASNMAAILRRSDTGGQALTSDLTRLLPTTTADARRRNMITTHSADIDRPGAVPYVWNRDPALAPATRYAWNAAAGFPLAAGNFTDPFGPAPNSIQTNRPAIPAASEFSPAGWQSQMASLLRVNLNRPLAFYPNPVNGAIAAADMPAYTAAAQDRIILAQDLFDRLWRTTGAPDPATVNNANTDEFRTLRWLAQLAVNMVDYIDQDDYMTIFNWSPVVGNEFVIGTELPGLLINEVFAQFENVPGDAGLADPMTAAATSYRLNVWAELFNPRVDSAALPGAGTTRLVNNGQAVYRLHLARYSAAGQFETLMADPANTLGASAGGILPVGQSTVQDWPDTAAIPGEVLSGGARFNDPARLNNGFYVVGPANTFFNATVDPALPVTHRSASMTLPLPLNATQQERRPTLFLQRLACPHLPPGANNPYVTVDTFQYPDVPLAQANPHGHGGVAPNNNASFTAITDRRSYGRYQPLTSLDMREQAPNPALANQAQATFYQHNYEGAAAPALNAASNTLKTSGFDWLAHLDRQVVSPVELTMVSAWKPHQLTEKFVSAPAVPPGGGGTPQQHMARWFDPAARLHRFLEFVQTAPRTVGVTPGGRIPGKININTMSDADIFSALCDAHESGGVPVNNRFLDAQARALFAQLLARRQPGGVTAFNAPDPFLSATPDRPFRSLAEGEAPGGDEWTNGPRGIDHTILAPANVGNPNGARLLDPHGNTLHPHQNLELLNKVYNNLTTRSNVFAVWVTVGYFEIAPNGENFRPVRLGAEIGRSEGRQIRHRMFAIVDRTKLESMRLDRSLVQAVNPQAGTRAYAELANPTSVTNPNTGKPWTLRDGTILTFQPDTDISESTAMYLDGTSNTFKGQVYQPYNTTQMPMVHYGNPGPWLRYNPKRDPCMLYFSVID